MSKKSNHPYNFTDRETGTFSGLMLALRKYLDRLDVRPAYELNKKPRRIDCLILDCKDFSEPFDNDITRIFSKHNLIELKNPNETLDINTIWKVISYADQYKTYLLPEEKELAVQVILYGNYDNPRLTDIFLEDNGMDEETKKMLYKRFMGKDFDEELSKVKAEEEKKLKKLKAENKRLKEEIKKLKTAMF